MRDQAATTFSHPCWLMPPNPLRYPDPDSVTPASAAAWHRREMGLEYNTSRPLVRDDHARLAAALDVLTSGVGVEEQRDNIREAARFHLERGRPWPQGWGNCEKGKFHAAAAVAIVDAAQAAFSHRRAT